jgi:hypothetical protein
MKGTTLSMLKSTVSALGAETKGRAKITYIAVLLGLAAAFFAALSGSQGSSATVFDNTLSTFTVAGQDVLNQHGNVLEVSSVNGNGGVQVTASTTDSGATITSIQYDAGDGWTNASNFSSSNGTGEVYLAPDSNSNNPNDFHNNTVKVTVNSQNGTEADYLAFVHVAPNNVDTLSSFTVSSDDVEGGLANALPQNSIVTEPAGTTSVDVSAIPTNLGLGSWIEYGSSFNNLNNSSDSGQFTWNVQPGANQLAIRVYASNAYWGEGDYKDYSTTIQVENVNLVDNLVNIDGDGYANGDTYTLPAGNTSIDVSATAVDANLGATVDGTGNNIDVPVGYSDLTVTVNGWDGSTNTYVIHIHRLNNDTTLTSDSVVEGQDGIQNGDTVYVDHTYYDATPSIDILPNDSNASISNYSEPDFYVWGDNYITFDVTAEDGTVEHYSISVYVQNGDTDLDGLSINGDNMNDGNGGWLDSYTLSQHADSVNVEATPIGYNAEATVSGDTGLVNGNNTVTVTVTAEDGTTQDYIVTVYNPSNDTSFADFAINGDSYDAGSTVNLPAGTTDVTVDYLLSDSNASAVITGDSGLVVGDNTLTAVVTAEDGSQNTYTWTLHVYDGDSSLATLTLNGMDTSDGDNIPVTFTDHVDVVAVPTSPNATVEIQGDTGLVLGDNTVTVIVTADDGTQTISYINVYVQNNDTSLSTFTIDGQDATDGAELTLDSGNGFAVVDAVPTDPNAIVTVDGDTGLTISGTSLITVTVSAEDGTEQTYTVSVYAQSGNTDLAQLTLNGYDVEDGAKINVPAGTPAVSVVASAVDSHSTVEVSGASVLHAGDNAISVAVTAENGNVNYEWLHVHVNNSPDTGLVKFTVNGDDVEDGSIYQLPAGTTGVSVVAISSSATSDVNVYGATGLNPGSNRLYVEVKAQNGAVQYYNVNLHVAATVISSDTGLAQFTVNGEAVEDGSIYALPAGTTGVSVVAVAHDSGASVAVYGANGLVAGDNKLFVEVTAADGTVGYQYVTLRVDAAAASSETGLAQLTVNGTDVSNGDTVEVAAGNTSVAVVAGALDSGASVSVAGASGLKVGNNTLTVTVTAADGTVATYSVTLHVAAAPKANKINIALQLKNYKAGSAKLTAAQKAKVRDWVQTAQGFSAGNLVGYVKKGASNANIALAYKRAAALQAYIQGIAGPGAKYSIHVYTTTGKIQAGFRLTGTY